MIDNFNSNLTVSFSGHRPSSLPGKGDSKVFETQKLMTKLQEQIKIAINQDKYIFVHGGMAGFDVLAAEQVLKIKKQYPNIILASVAPYRLQFFSRENCWTPEWIERARKVFARHDIGIVIAEQYRKGIYYERDRALINNSSELICYWNGESGGTKYTVDYALEKSKHIINLY